MNTKNNVNNTEKCSYVRTANINTKSKNRIPVSSN